MNRRDFLKASAALATAPVVPALPIAAAAAPAEWVFFFDYHSIFDGQIGKWSNVKVWPEGTPA